MRALALLERPERRPGQHDVAGTRVDEEVSFHGRRQRSANVKRTGGLLFERHTENTIVRGEGRAKGADHGHNGRGKLTKPSEFSMHS